MIMIVVTFGIFLILLVIASTHKNAGTIDRTNALLSLIALILIYTFAFVAAIWEKLP